MSGSAYEVLAGPYRYDYGPKGSDFDYQLAVTASREEDDLRNTMIFYKENPLQPELYEPRAALAKCEAAAAKRLEKKRKVKTCSTCHMQRAINGSCAC